MTLTSVDLPRRRLVGSAVLGAAGAWWALPVPARASMPDAAVSRRWALMGTQVDLQLPSRQASPAVLQAAMAAAGTQMQRLADMMSRYRDDSVVAQLARQAGRSWVAVPAEMMAVLQRAKALANDSAGAFDITVGAFSAWRFDEARATRPGTAQPTVPSAAQLRAERRLLGIGDLQLDPAGGRARLRRAGMRLDLGGVAKLPILQAGLEALAAHGVREALLNGGGDVLALGAPPGRPWRIGLRDPAHPERLLAVLPLSNGVIASSGDYERAFWRDGRHYHHVIDPATGRPTEGVHGVSLVADHPAAVNGLGATAMVLGPQRGAAWLAERTEQALLVRRDGSLWASPALAARLLPPPGATRVRGLG